MYERLDKLRGDLERAKRRRTEADAKVKIIEEKLREAENTQVLADVNALKLTPEQVAQFLQLVASGQMPVNRGSMPDLTGGNSQGHSIDSAVKTELPEQETKMNEDEMEDLKNEEAIY